MSETDNNDTIRGALEELGSKLRDEFSEDFTGLKTSMTDIKETLNLSKTESEGLTNVADFVEHLNSCDNPNCEIHKSINTTSNNAYMKGFLLGAKFGKQKRN